jgi:outer membrane protein OmpA-like peptidoglycan-associated protein
MDRKMISKRIYEDFVFLIFIILLTSCATTKKRTAIDPSQAFRTLLFVVNSGTKKPGLIDGLTQVVDLLNRYPETTILVKGYTDTT